MVKISGSPSSYRFRAIWRLLIAQNLFFRVSKVPLTNRDVASSYEIVSKYLIKNYKSLMTNIPLLPALTGELLGCY